MRIVRRCKAVLLGFSLAAVAMGPVAAQTVIGGDGRPEVTVDRSVLDQLGPQPTLPDMLLGRQPMPPPTAPVRLHPPHAKSAVAEARTARPATRKLAEASTKPKAPKLAKAAKKAKAAATVATTGPSVSTQAPSPPQSSAAAIATPAPTPTAETKAAAPSKLAAGKPNKSLASSYAAPPPPPASTPTAVANADMPGASAPLTPPPSQPEPLSGKPAKQSKALTSSVGMNADTAGATPAKPAETSAPAPAQSSNAAVPSAPPVPATPAPEAKTETKTAMLTPPPATSGPAPEGVVLSIPFVKDGAALPNEMLPGLVSLAKRAEADSALQLQVMAYASGDADNASKAQRLSLARALAVRAFLKDQGVPGARIDVRALGNRVPEGPPDRVDLVEQKH